MRNVVDFRTNFDLGEFDVNSIVPYVDGEPASQTVLRRPPENLRTRSDTLRGLVRDHLVLMDLNQAGPLMWGGGTITFAGAAATYSGIFTTSANLFVSSFATPGDDAVPATYIGSTKASLTVGTYADNQIVFTSVQKQFQGATLASADASWISVEIVHTGSLSVTLNDRHNVYITIDSGTTTCQQVIDAVSLSAASALVVASLGAGSTGTEPAATWTTTDWAGNYSHRFLTGGVAGTSHSVLNTVFATFFSTPENVLRKGDTLAIWYDTNVDLAGIGGRFQSTFENVNVALSSASLFNSRREPAKIPNSIPICKCVSDDLLIFADGTYVYRGVPTRLGVHEDAALVTALGWSRLNTGTHTPPLTVRQALNNADQDLNTVMTEVEDARDSSIFSTFATLDRRLEAGDTHSRAFVSVTDGTLSTGGLYNGAEALQTAIQAMDATGEGGRILVRRGTYTISSALTINSAIRIIGVEDDVIISSTTLANFAITFTPSGTRPSQAGIENVKFIGPQAVQVPYDAEGAQVILRDIWCVTSYGIPVSAAAILIGGFQVQLENIRIDGSLANGPTKGIVCTTNANQCVLRNIRLTGFDESLSTEGQRIVIENIQMDITGEPGIAIYLGGNDNSVLNAYVNVTHLTPTGAVFQVTGNRCSIKNASCAAHTLPIWIGADATNCVLEGLSLTVLENAAKTATMLRYDATVKNTVRQVTVVLDDYAKILTSSGSRGLQLENVLAVGTINPGKDILQVTTQMTLRNIRVGWESDNTKEITGHVLDLAGDHNLLENVSIDLNYHYLQYGSDAPFSFIGAGNRLVNCTFQKFYVPADPHGLGAFTPIIAYQTPDTVDQQLIFDGCTIGKFDFEAGVNCNAYVLRCPASPMQENCGAIFRNCTFDTTAVTDHAGGGGTREFFSDVGFGTSIEGCHFVGTGTSFAYLVNSKGARSFHFHNNHAHVLTPFFFRHMYVDATSNGDLLIFTNNTLTVANGAGGMSTVRIMGGGTDYIPKVVVSNNIVNGDTGNDESFEFGYITSLVGFGNIANAGYTGLDAGLGGTITTQVPATWALGNI